MIEVADTSAEADRRVKIPLYARHGVPETWLIDLNERRLEAYREPSAEGYRQLLKPARDASVASVRVPLATLTAAELFDDGA